MYKCPYTIKFLQKNFGNCESSRLSAAAKARSVLHESFHHKGTCSLEYCPPLSLWFYQNTQGSSKYWCPFSIRDSDKLESYYQFILNNEKEKRNEKPVLVFGCIFEVFVSQRLCKAIYWEEEDKHVLRGTWFYIPENKFNYIPYTENVADILEINYKLCLDKNSWPSVFWIPIDVKKNPVEFTFYSKKEMYYKEVRPSIFHIIVNIIQAMNWDPILTAATKLIRGRESLLKVIPPPPVHVEQAMPQHIVFAVHGIGPRCNVMGSSLIESVDKFRQLSNRLLQDSCNLPTGYVEYFPVNWHKAIHGSLDKHVNLISLSSVPLLRNFTNDTIVDVLFYTARKYGIEIKRIVSSEILRQYNLFASRHPNLDCKFSIIGHSLGSVISFDLLSQQIELSNMPTLESILISNNLEEYIPKFKENSITIEKCFQLTTEEWKTMGFDIGVTSKLFDSLKNSIPPFLRSSHDLYPQFGFQFENCFLWGSPLGIFLSSRGIHFIPEDYSLPTCHKIYNIFHPYDPVAFRIETLIHNTSHLPPLTIEHNVPGGKRMHRVIKDWIKDKLRRLFSLSTRGTPKQSTRESKRSLIQYARRSQKCFQFQADLNRSERIDFMLQEAPLEYMNEYLFALSAHGCYWNSEDTALFVIKNLLINEDIY